MAEDFYWGTGRRKTAVARVKVIPNGSGEFLVNREPSDEYFKRARDKSDIFKPLKDTKRTDQYDVHAFVKGGGFTGQSGAILLGVTRGLVEAEPELEDILRKKGHLTRDSRMKERKKYGRAGARKSFQYSKR